MRSRQTRRRHRGSASTSPRSARWRPGRRAGCCSSQEGNPIGRVTRGSGTRSGGRVGKSGWERAATSAHGGAHRLDTVHEKASGCTVSREWVEVRCSVDAANRDVVPPRPLALARLSSSAKKGGTRLAEPSNPQPRIRLCPRLPSNISSFRRVLHRCATLHASPVGP